VPEARWIDLLDPSLDELQQMTPCELEESAVDLLLEPPKHDDEPRPTLRTHGDYIFGVFLTAVVVHEEDLVYYQEVDVVVTHDTLLTVRKTPPNGKPPYDPTQAKQACRDDDDAGMLLYRLVDDVAERYLDLIDDLDEEIDTLEDLIEKLPAEQTRERISELRHDLLHVRRTLAPTRDAVRRVVDDVVEVTKGSEVFPHDVEVAFNSVYDKLLRAIDGLELSRDLLASVRDYHQSKIANDQNEVMKRLTVIASLLLFPTLVVGVYGQNFDHIPELHWYLGYAWSWGIIVVSTILQLVIFRWKRWI
jgi:magnesium transporter